ncbi:DUF418 domain-containing protein [Shouchella clausii]|uniref:DUF418 domain-containing protein n=2 Tax=Shouchella clausii TaxID=79880 RepID=UPI00211CAB2B|nr:hypothetical protein [Shouchella clausii]MCR1289494.1 hypothetical protein [Shouchella clausii]
MFHLISLEVLCLVALAHASLFLGSSLLTRPESMSMYDTIVNYLSVFLVDNRARAMFALLFGYGLTLIVRSYLKRNKPIKDAKTSLYRRAWFRILFGFILSVLIGGKDILAIYGTALLACCWLLFRSDKTVLRSIMAVSLAYVVILPLTWIGMAYAQFNGNAILPGNYAYYFERVTSQFIQFATGGPFIAHFLLPVGVSILIGIYFGQKGLLNESPKNKPFLKKAAVYGLSISLIGAVPHALYSNQLIELPPALVGLTFSLHMAYRHFRGCCLRRYLWLNWTENNKPKRYCMGDHVPRKTIAYVFYLQRNHVNCAVLKTNTYLGNQLGMAAGWGLTLLKTTLI